MRNTQKSDRNALRVPAAPNAPVVTRGNLDGPQLSFLAFLKDPLCMEFCAALFGGTETSAGTALAEFRKATAYHYYGHRRGKKKANPGTLTAGKAQDKKTLKAFARRAYRGDPDRRGVTFWERVAWLVWDAYRALMSLRRRAARITQQEVQRIAGLPKKRASRASYMQRYRASKRTRTGRHVKTQTRRQWRKRLGLSAPPSESETRRRTSRT
jgi:hypothetical protein